MRQHLKHLRLTKERHIFVRIEIPVPGVAHIAAASYPRRRLPTRGQGAALDQQTSSRASKESVNCQCEEQEDMGAESTAISIILSVVSIVQ